MAARSARPSPPPFYPAAHEANDVRPSVRPTLHNVALSITNSNFEIARRDAFHARFPLVARASRENCHISTSLSKIDPHMRAVRVNGWRSREWICNVTSSPYMKMNNPVIDWSSAVNLDVDSEGQKIAQV